MPKLKDPASANTFSGRPCKFGHTERLFSGACRECNRLYMLKANAKRAAKRDEVKAQEKSNQLLARFLSTKIGAMQ